MSGTNTRSSPQGNKRPRNTPQDELASNQIPQPIMDLWDKRSAKTLIDAEQFSTIQMGLHTDLRDIKWTLMVGPALTPRSSFSRKMLEANRLVVHVVALDYVERTLKENRSNDPAEEGMAVSTLQRVPTSLLPTQLLNQRCTASKGSASSTRHCKESLRAFYSQNC